MFYPSKAMSLELPLNLPGSDVCTQTKEMLKAQAEVALIDMVS